MNGEQAADTKTGCTEAPEWSKQALREFMKYQQKQSKVLSLSRHGLHVATMGPKITQFLADSHNESKRPATGELESAKEIAEFAQKEIDQDFPTLNSQAIISLWGALESLILSAVADWIMNRPEILRQESWRNIKVKISEYESLDSQERASHLASLQDQSLGGPLKAGASRFESLLGTIGLAGEVPEEVRRRLWELQQIRNVFVHRAGRADRKLCEACPWMGLKVGDEITVTSTKCDDYFHAALEYVVLLIRRIRQFFGDFETHSHPADG